MVIIHELKKLFIKQKGVFIVLLLLIIEVGYIYYQVEQTYNFQTQEDREIYEEYMELLSGKFDAEKEKYIITEDTIISNAKSQYNIIRAELSDRKISENEYLEKYSQIEKKIKKDIAFQKVWEKYEFVVQNPENRYFTAYDIPFISNDDLDFLLIFTIILLTSMFLLTEKQTGMIDYIKTTKNGSRKTALVKLGIIMSYSVLLVLLISGIEYMAFKVNKEILNYPLQSLSFYANSPYNFSIGQMWQKIILFRCIGFASLGGVIVLLAETTKSSLFTIFIPTSIITIQEFLFTDKMLEYLVPFPTGLMKTTGYFRGDAYGTFNKGSSIEETMCVFSNIPKKYFIGMVFLCMTIILFSIFVIIRSYSNRNGRKTSKNILMLCMVISVFLNGCSVKQPEVIYNCKTSIFASQNEEYMVADDEEGVFLTNKNTLTHRKLIRNPFRDERNISSGIVYDNNYYYMKNYGIDDLIINKVSLENFSEETIFSHSGEGKMSFMNLYQRKYVEDSFFSGNVRYFFVNKSKLFLIESCSGRVMEVDLKSRKQRVILDEGLYYDNISFDGVNIYFINGKLELKRFNTVTKKNTLLMNKKATKLFLLNDGILCVCDNILWKMSFEDKNFEKITEMSIFGLSYDEDYVYFTDMEHGYLYRVHKTGGEKELLYKGKTVFFEVVRGTNKIYIQSYNEQALERVYEFIEVNKGL